MKINENETGHMDTQTHRDTETQKHRHTDIQTHRHTGTQTHRHTDTHTRRHRHTSTRTHGHVKTLTHRHTDADIQCAIFNDRSSTNSDTGSHTPWSPQPFGHKPQGLVFRPVVDCIWHMHNRPAKGNESQEKCSHQRCKT